MDEFKKFAGQAGTFFNRAKQVNYLLKKDIVVYISTYQQELFLPCGRVHNNPLA